MKITQLKAFVAEIIKIEFWEKINKITLIVGLIGAILYIYGNVAKLFEIYFFWESSFIGLILLTVSIGIFVLVEFLIKVRVLKEYYRRGWTTLFRLVFIIFSILIMTLFLSSDSLSIAKDAIKDDESINNITGEIYGFGWFPDGEVMKYGQSNNKGIDAKFEILVKGKKRYLIVNIELKKKPGSDWVISINK